MIVTTSPVEDLAANLVQVDYNSTYGSLRYLMIFSGKAVPANGTVPITAPIAVPASGSGSLRFGEKGLPIRSPGIVIAVSSTSTTLTIDASATIDITAHVEDWEMQPTGTSSAGDLTTAVKALAVWTEAAGATTGKKLKRLQVKNLAAAVRYAVVYAVDAPAATSRIVAQYEVGASKNVDINFGYNDGLQPFQKKASDATVQQGCTVWCALTTAAGNQASANDFNIKATYA